MNYVNLANEKRPLQVTPRVVSLWMSETKKGFDSLESLSMADMEVLLYHGLRSGYRASHEGRYPEWTRETFQDWMDRPEGWKALNVVQKALEEMMQAMNDDAEAEEAAEAEGEGPGKTPPAEA